MSASQTWIVCELSGRWAAALRMAFARLRGARTVPHLFEARNLSELTAQLNEHPSALGLIEVRPANLAEVLQLLADASSRRPGRFAALLDQTLWSRESGATISREFGAQQVADVLWEAGAAEVVESPRQLDGLLAFGERIAAVANLSVEHASGGQSIADWACSIVPWQDQRSRLA